MSDQDDTTNPPADNYDDLKKDPRVRNYVEGRLRGQGRLLKDVQGRLAAAESQLATLEGTSVDGAAMGLELELLRSSVDAFTESLIGRLPPNLQTLVPRSLPAHELTAWLSANLSTLTGSNTPQRQVAVHGGGGRSAEAVDAEQAAARLMSSRINRGR